jgi:hypothetical protein
MNTFIRKSIFASLGVSAAVLAAAGLAPLANADDIDMYGDTDVNTFTLYNGTGDATVFTTTTNAYETVDETTGVVTPHFSFPTTVETMEALPPGVTQAGGYAFTDANTGFFGDTTTTYDTSSLDTDFFLANGHDFTQFLPLFITDMFSPGVPDGDLFPF